MLKNIRFFFKFNNYVLVQGGGLVLVDGDQMFMCEWDIAKNNYFTLKTWISLCLSLDSITNACEMYQNGKKLEQVRLHVSQRINNFVKSDQTEKRLICKNTKCTAEMGDTICIVHRYFGLRYQVLVSLNLKH